MESFLKEAKTQHDLKEATQYGVNEHCDLMFQKTNLASNLASPVQVTYMENSGRKGTDKIFAGQKPKL